MHQTRPTCSRRRRANDGDTDLDLYTQDENDNLIAKNDDSSDYCVAYWRPRWTGTFSVEIVVRHDSTTNTGTNGRLQPRQSRGQLQQRAPQRAVCQPQQQCADHPQQQPRRAPLQDAHGPMAAVA